MLVDYNARSIYYRSMQNAKERIAKGDSEKRAGSTKSAEGFYKGARGAYENCFELAKLYDDEDCKKEALEGLKKCDRLISQVASKKLDK